MTSHVISIALLAVWCCMLGVNSFLSDQCPVSTSPGNETMTVKERILAAPIVVHARAMAATSSVGYDPKRQEQFYGKRYFYKMYCVLKNEPDVKIRPHFSLSESGYASCTFHQADVLGDVILTLNVTSRGYLRLYDADQQAAGHDIKKYPVIDVTGWLKESAVIKGPKCPIRSESIA